MYGNFKNIVLVLLRLLGDELSRPVSTTDSELEYLPSQYICEFIKLENYDGILYKSSVNNPGFNLVLFEEQSKVNCIGTKLYQVNDVNFGYTLKDI